MNMVEFILGAAAGVGGMIAKDQILGNESANRTQKELKSLYEENEKLRNRNKDAERQVEDLLAENKKLRNQSKSSSNDRDDLEDELDSAKARIKKLTQQNDELLRKIAEYKAACESYETEINHLKNA
jgi:septal ring factor EnvC (AmiA/AmiB activator)